MNAFRVLAIALATLLVSTTGGFAADAGPVADFSLSDSAGKAWKLHGQQSKAVVVVFLSTECPMSNGYLPSLSDLAKKYADKNVAVVGVFPDADTTAEQLKAHAREYKVPFPLLLDPSHVSVKVFGAKNTPEVFVLDDTFAVRYQGRIDDGYSARLKAKPVVARQDLLIALDELLAGKAVTIAETKAFGCPIGSPAKKTVPAGAAVTFYKDVLPVLQSHCQTCHRPGQVGPFALTSYKQAAKWADSCLEEVKAKKMPPWKAGKNDLLTGSRSLPDGAIAILEKWVDQGMPEGDPKDAPPPRKFTEGWALGEPDLILEAPEEVIVGPNGRDLFRVVVFPTNLSEDKYISAMEVKPGNARAVHHTLQMIDTSGTAQKIQAEAQKKSKPADADRGPGYSVSMGWGFLPKPGNMLGGWAPGLLPKRLPEGIGQTLPQGADICVQIHFHRTGKEEKDRTKIGIYFAKGPIHQKYRSLAATGAFKTIPAGDRAFEVESSWKLTGEVTLYRLVPHMHLLGKEIELRATLPGEKERLMIRIPDWDYNWQEQYELKEPMKLPKGTILKVRAVYDNSADNPNNPTSPPKTVRFGEQTTDEMCFVFLGIASKSPAWRLLLPEGDLFKK
jgi:peroxiredoxin